MVQECRDTGITYKIECLGDCQEKFVIKYKYDGQTGQNGFTHKNKHKSDYDNQKEDSPLWKHCVNVHNGERQNFQMTIIDKCRGDATKRQILEAIHIQRAPENTSMNSRSEWNTAKIPRIQIQTDVHV